MTKHKTKRFSFDKKFSFEYYFVGLDTCKKWSNLTKLQKKEIIDLLKETFKNKVIVEKDKIAYKCGNRLKHKTF